MKILASVQNCDIYYQARLDMLTHPSKTLMGEEIPCEDCEDPNKTDLDDIEMLEMRNEARLRLLKAEKVRTITVSLYIY